MNLERSQVLKPSSLLISPHPSYNNLNKALKDLLLKNNKLNFSQFKMIAISLLFILSGCASLQSSKSNKIGADINTLNSNSFRIAADILHEDIDELVTRLIEIHPEPFALISQQDFMRKVQVIKQSIRYPLTRNEFYVRIAPLIAQLGDIHSRLDFPKSLLNGYGKTPSKLFPLAVLFESDGLFVAADLSSNPKIPTGAVITSINNAPIDFLLQMMERLTAKETTAGLRRKIQIDFPWLLAVMGYAKPVYEISYFWKAHENTIRIDGIDPPPTSSEQVDSTNTEIEKDNDVTEYGDQSPLLINDAGSTTSYYGFSKLNSKTALLWFNDFNEDPHVFASFLEDKFEQLAEQGISSLIIDVRYNDGGLSQNIKNLLSHLADEPVYWARTGEINISKQLKNLHYKRTKQRRKNKFQWGLQWLPLEWTSSLRYEISWGDLGEKVLVEFEPVEPAQSIIPQNVIVLTNGFCYSACSSFVAAVNQYELAQTIGEITGSFAEVQYAYPLITKLPHTQLNLILPTMKLVFNSQSADRQAIAKEGNNLILPKQTVVRTLEQIIQRQDVVLGQALKQIESGEFR